MNAIKVVYKKHPILILFIAFIVLPLVCTLTIFWSLALETLPREDYAFLSPKVKADVSISRDKHGVAYIDAIWDEDAFFGVGYVHAQDRLWQLELIRRMSRGELSEVLGKSTLGLDLFVRTLGLSQAADSAWQSLNEDSKQALIKYTEGINAWQEQVTHLPIEFRLLGMKPTPWQPKDALCWMKMFGLGLAGNFQKDISRFAVTQSLDIAKANNLLDIELPIKKRVTHSSTDFGLTELLIGMQELNSISEKWQLSGKNLGSNAWVIGPELTADAHAVLANDPHLSTQIPSQWYALQIHTKRLNVQGMSLVGLPFVMLGCNTNIAWGATNMMADTMDLYFERTSYDAGEKYLSSEGWKPFHEREEIISVRADFPHFLRTPLKPVKLKVRETERGPLISDLFHAFSMPVSLSWTGLQKGDTSFEAFLALQYAENWKQFSNAMKLHVSPAMNILYIDRNQNIGYRAIGAVPLRRAEVGMFPTEGWLATNAWNGYIPFDEMPSAFNPESSIIVSANNKIVDDDFPYYISNDWAPRFRAQRIETLINNSLDTKGKIDRSDIKQVQLDTRDESARALKALLKRVTFADDGMQKMADYIVAWDQVADIESVGATAYYTWVRHLKSRLLTDDFKSYWNERDLKQQQREFLQELQTTELVRLMEDESLDWCDDQSTVTVEACAETVESALRDAYVELKGLLGGDVENWAWGNAHTVEFEHMPFSSVKGLDLLFSRKAVRGGAPDAVNVSGFKFFTDQGYRQKVGATFRQIVSFGNNGAEQEYVIATGQSGNVFSEHYDDMLPSMSEGQFYFFHNRYVGACELRCVRILAGNSNL